MPSIWIASNNGTAKISGLRFNSHLLSAVNADAMDLTDK